MMLPAGQKTGWPQACRFKPSAKFFVRLNMVFGRPRGGFAPATGLKNLLVILISKLKSFGAITCGHCTYLLQLYDKGEPFSKSSMDKPFKKKTDKNDKIYRKKQTKQLFYNTLKE